MGDKMVFSAIKDSPKYINTEHQDRVQEHISGDNVHLLYPMI